MYKIRIIALHSDKYNIIKQLHQDAVIDIRKSKRNALDDIPLENMPQLSEFLIKFKSAEAILSEYTKVSIPSAKKTQLEGKELIKECHALKYLDRLFDLENEKRELNESASEISETIKIARMFDGTGVDFSLLKSAVLKFTAFTLNSKDADLLRERLSAKKNIEYEVVSKKLKDTTLIFLAYEKNSADAVNNLLHDFKILEIDLSNKLLKGPADRLESMLQQQLEEVRKHISKIDAALSSAADGHIAQISALREMLEVEVARAGVSLYFKKTNSAFYVEGWVPKKRYASLENNLKKVAKGRCITEIIDSDGELAPTLTSRPAFLRPFDYMMEFMSIPRSDELDPTWIFILSFPIFYGRQSAYCQLLLTMVPFIYKSKREPQDHLQYSEKYCE